MIQTKNATYLHIPKTGGTWVRHVLRPIALVELHHQLPVSRSENVFAFVRNPWAWYVCSYNASLYGSKDDPANPSDPLIIALGKKPTFEEFIWSQVAPSLLFKKKIYALFKLRQIDNALLSLAEQWIEQDIGWYQLMCDMFLENTTKVGTTENIKNDLKEMLLLSNELTDEIDNSLETMPPKNSGNIKVNYQLMYNNELQQAVYDSSKSLIDRFNYSF
jgi:hypothetical protein